MESAGEDTRDIDVTSPYDDASAGDHNIPAHVNIFQHGMYNYIQLNINNSITNSDLDVSSESEDEEQYTPDDDHAKELKTSTRIISSMELQQLSRNIGGSWRRFVRHLGVDDADIDYECSKSHHGGTPEVVYQLLLQWKQDSIDPSISTIAVALEKSKLKHLFQNLNP